MQGQVHRHIHKNIKARSAVSKLQMLQRFLLNKNLEAFLKTYIIV